MKLNGCGTDFGQSGKTAENPTLKGVGFLHFWPSLQTLGSFLRQQSDREPAERFLRSRFSISAKRWTKPNRRAKTARLSEDLTFGKRYDLTENPWKVLRSRRLRISANWGPRYIPTAPCYVCFKNAQCIAEKRSFFGGWRVTETEKNLELSWSWDHPYPD